MDYTLLENPYVDGVSNIIPIGNKIAKINCDEKMPRLRKNWLDGILKIEEEKKQNTIAKYDKVDNVMTKEENELLKKLGASCFGYYNDISLLGARKLKVKDVVIEKTSKYYDKYYLKNNIVSNRVPFDNKEVTEKEIIKSETPTVEVKQEPISNTRISRLERTEDMEKSAPQELRREDVQPTNGVINTPARFEKKVDMNPYEALISDNREEPDNVIPFSRAAISRVEDTRGLEQNKGGDPNLYTKLVHGGSDGLENSELSIKLQDAKNKLSTANEEREKARIVNANLEEEVANIKLTIEKLRKEREQQEQKELDSTLNLLRDAKADILDETRKYDNLQGELAELIRQRDALLNNPYVSDEDSYSDSLKRAA